MLTKECIAWNKIGTLTFVSLYKKEWTNKMFGVFNCDCWCKKIMRLDAVKKDASCWCLQRSKSAERLRIRMNDPKNKEFVSSINRTHGMKWTSEYNIWAWIKNRTGKNPHWKAINYKKRWIIMCDEWRNSFEKFYADMWARPSPEYSIDRIDNNWNYEPSNCRWSTTKEQNNNTNRNVIIEFLWVKRNVRQWSEFLWVNRQYLYNRKRIWYDFQTTINSLLCLHE